MARLPSDSLETAEEPRRNTEPKTPGREPDGPYVFQREKGQGGVKAKAVGVPKPVKPVVSNAAVFSMES